jgi:hypothetical protein
LYQYKNKKTTAMSSHDEMVFKNDSLHGLEEPKYKTKTQEDTGNQEGYQGPNRKERDQAQRVLETQQPTDIDTNNDINWKVVGRKSNTPLRKSVMQGGHGGQSKTNSLYQSSTRGGAFGRNDGHDKAVGTVHDKRQDKSAGTIRDKEQDKAAGTLRGKGQDKAASIVRDVTVLVLFHRDSSVVAHVVVVFRRDTLVRPVVRPWYPPLC